MMSLSGVMCVRVDAEQNASRRRFPLNKRGRVKKIIILDW
jgi:hypothetical protein